MSKERELLKRWLIDFGKIHPDVELMKNTQTLLAQPEQEPVAWVFPSDLKRFETQETNAVIYSVEMGSPNENSIPLYTAPPAPDPLSDEEIKKLWTNQAPQNEFECVRLVEKAHGIGV